MRRRAGSLAFALLLAAAGSASAQAGSCDLVESQRVERNPITGIIQIEGPFLVRCEGGAVLRASQGTLSEYSRELVLVGNVHFEDPEQTLTADNATYTSPIGRLYATGNVVFTNRTEGSTIRGPELEYYRPMEGRPDAIVNAGQRPHLTLQPRERTEGSEPLEIDADRVSIQGRSDLSAFGDVVIRRSDLDARAAEARYQEDTEALELRGNAEIRNEDFALAGEVIHADLAEGALEHVQARTGAALEGKDLTVTAAELQMFFTDELLQRAVARGGEGDARPRAVARNFRLTADSIDALTPGQELEQVIAIGRARGETVDTTRADSGEVAVAPAPPADTAAAPDSAASTLPDSAASALALIDHDWIVGDTLIGYFEAPDSLAPADSAAVGDTTVVLRRIVARGAAQSLYRVEARDSAAAGDGRRGVNYLAGETIELTFEEGELDVAQVTGLRRGLYLDPLPPDPDPEDPPPGTSPAPTGGPAPAPTSGRTDAG